MKKIVILGFGGFGRTIEDVIISAKLFDEIVFLDDNVIDEKVLGKCTDFKKFISEETWFYPAFGNNNLRIEWMNMMRSNGAKIATIIHPSAYIGRNTEIGEGCVILQNAVINTTAVIKSGCIVNFGAVVDHDVIIEKGVHLCINSAVKSNNRIPPFAKIEAGQAIFNNTFKWESEK